MKISELIKLLEEAKARFGDVEVRYFNDCGHAEDISSYEVVVKETDGWTRSVPPDDADGGEVVRIELE